MLTGLQTTRRMDNICWVTSWLPSIWSMMIDHRDSDWSLFNCYSRLGLDPLVIDAPAIPPIFPQTKLFLTRFFLLTHDFNFFFFAFLHAQEASGRKLGPGSNKKGLIMVTSKLVVHSHQKTGGSPPTQVIRLWTNQPSARTKQKVEKWLIFLYLFILFSIWFFCFLLLLLLYSLICLAISVLRFSLFLRQGWIYIYVYRR